MPEIAAVKESAGWTTVAFGDVVQLSKERSSDPEADGYERYIGLEHIDPGELRVRRWGDIADGVTFTSVFRPGQVLFGKRRAYQRKVAVAHFSGVCSGDIYVLEPKGGALLPELLPFICQTEAFFEHAVGTSTGSLSPRTNWKSLADFEFALPPIEEQQHIALAFQMVSGAQESFGRLLSSIEAARRSLLLHIFRPSRGPKDEYPGHWERRPISELGETQVGIRKHPGSLDGPNMRPYLRVANVLDGFIDWSEVKQINVPTNDETRCALASGDILLNKGNSIELVGRSSLYTGREGSKVYFQDHLLRFRCSEVLIPEFAQAFLQHNFYSFEFQRLAVISTTIATIPTPEFLRVEVPVPPHEEQRKIAEDLAILRSASEAAVGRMVMLRKLMEALNRSIYEAQ